VPSTGFLFRRLDLCDFSTQKITKNFILSLDIHLFYLFLSEEKNRFPRGQGRGAPKFYFIPFFLGDLKPHTKILEPYDNTFWGESNYLRERREQIQLAPMEALAPGSAHARPSAQAPYRH
jgi:hypothetical protein